MSNEAVKRQTSRKRKYAEGWDYYPTPPWATRALLEHQEMDMTTIWEPAAGAGDMMKVFYEVSPTRVSGSDINPRHRDIERLDFLSPLENCNGPQADWIVTNPPFTLLDDFIRTAHQLTSYGTAFFCRLQALEGQARGEFFGICPPALVLVFSERVQGIAPQGFDLTKSSMTAYCWMVWRHDHKGDTAIRWIPNGTARRLTKEGDYEPAGSLPLYP